MRLTTLMQKYSNFLRLLRTLTPTVSAQRILHLAIYRFTKQIFEKEGLYMKETTDDMAKNTTGVFWVRDAREDFPGGQRALTMTVTDGRVQRKALWMDTMECH